MVNSKNSPQTSKQSFASRSRNRLLKRGQARGKVKSIRKNKRKGKKSTEVFYHSTKEIKVERALIENFIGLQKVMVGLSAKFDSLSSQISSLLQLFEISAKSLARKELASPSATNGLEAKKVMEKLDHLSAQAGLIGRGLALIHEVGTESEKSIIPLNPQRKSQQQMQKPSFSPAGMSPSILSKPQEAGSKPENTAIARRFLEKSSGKNNGNSNENVS